MFFKSGKFFWNFIDSEKFVTLYRPSLKFFSSFPISSTFILSKTFFWKKKNSAHSFGTEKNLRWIGPIFFSIHPNYSLFSEILIQLYYIGTFFWNEKHKFWHWHTIFQRQGRLTNLCHLSVVLFGGTMSPEMPSGVQKI